MVFEAEARCYFSSFDFILIEERGGDDAQAMVSRSTWNTSIGHRWLPGMGTVLMTNRFSGMPGANRGDTRSASKHLLAQRNIAPVNIGPELN